MNPTSLPLSPRSGWMHRRAILAGLLCLRLSLSIRGAEMAPPSLRTSEFIRVSENGKHFVLRDSGRRFIPWGFNYDHDTSHRLLESYWKSEWKTVVNDFAEMKALGANTVRVHLQVGRLMESPSKAKADSLALLSQLLSLAEAHGLYLDITGLGCYARAEVPAWYDALSEPQRWDVQAQFWEAIAETCQRSPAVFCYDLMNEPIVTSGQVEKEWTTGALGNFYYVQRINLDPAGRPQAEIARAWVDRMVGAIRRHDRHHLITVGVIPWALVFPNAKPLFYSPEAGQGLDFVSVHFYPKSGEVDKAVKALSTYAVGKPIVIEEMFPLSCSLDELDAFIDQSRDIATGWIGFYWGKTIREYQRQDKRDMGEEITLNWLSYFQEKAPSMTRPTR